MEKAPDENPSIGIILCAEKDHLEVELALQDINKPISIGVAWFVSSLVNFLVNRYFVFRVKNNFYGALIKYYTLALVVMGLKNYGLYMLLTDVFIFPELPGKVLAEISFFVFNYFLQQKLIFRMKRS